ncbi:Flp pilus assembly protein CpaB [Inquilinus sp. OTU3971]|uniref:Flp pilus assembly protein CpaB n=1 Tax=Inquilinus sp. OTU3971 TaxID=3043855 RepID=UPI00313EC67F
MIRVIILFVAVGAAGLAGWLVLGLRPNNDTMVVAAPAAASQPKMEEVLVAAGDLTPGQSIGEATVRWQAWPKDAVNPGLILRADQSDAVATLSGSVARSPFVAGEPIREDKLTRIDSGWLAAQLPSGKRAIAVRVSAESAAGGFILPNDHVDVIQTIARQSDQDGQRLSRTVVTNVRVLAIDQKANETKGETFVLGKTATLELDAMQAEVLAAAQTEGGLSIALRSAADNREQSRAVTADSKTVVVIRAGRREIVTLR